LYKTIDKLGGTIASMLPKQRIKAAAIKFLACAIALNGCPAISSSTKVAQAPLCIKANNKML
jgi:transposase-like protein